MKKIIGIIFSIMLLASCNQSKTDNIAYRVTEKDIIPEGITYSSVTNSFYISSIKKTKIIEINAETGNFKDFIPSNFLDYSFLGIITDDANEQLWACGNKTRNGIRYSSISKLDINNGNLLKSYITTDTVKQMYNDLAFDNDKNVYFTNSNEKNIYKIDHIEDSISLFYEGDEIRHPNGITISSDNKYLYVASNNNGIRIIEIKTQKVVNEVNLTISSKGLDGLKYYKNSLIGINNAVEKYSDTKICQYFLDESGTKITGMKIIDQDNPYFKIPTTFVIVKDELFCLATSHLANINSNYEIIDPEASKEVLILKYKLD